MSAEQQIANKIINTQNTINIAKEIDKMNVSDITPIYQQFNIKRDISESILSIRKIMENIESKIIKNNSNSSLKYNFFNPETIKEYCKLIPIMGKYKNVESEISYVITCHRNTKLRFYNLELQDEIQKIFFPYETFLSYLSDNKINNLQEQESVNNILKLIDALQHEYRKQRIIYSIREDYKTKEYIKLLKSNIVRLTKQKEKLYAITYSKLTQSTQKKLK